MDADSPASRTALGAARHRAAHQLLERGAIFTDPLAVPILSEDPDHLAEDAQAHPDRRTMRWFVSARSRLAEDVLAAGVACGLDQLVVLGAGLDTFAYRNPYAGLRVVEVDHPATQEWKRERLAEAGIEIPASAAYAPIDFERGDLASVLRTQVDVDRPVLFWWLGVTPYLTLPSIEATLRVLGAIASSTVVLDHAAPREAASPASTSIHDARREAVAKLGEPWLSELRYDDLAALLGACGFTDVRAEHEAAMIRRLLRLPPADATPPSHLAVASRGRLGSAGRSTGAQAARS